MFEQDILLVATIVAVVASYAVFALSHRKERKVANIFYSLALSRSHAHLSLLHIPFRNAIRPLTLPRILGEVCLMILRGCLKRKSEPGCLG